MLEEILAELIVSALGRLGRQIAVGATTLRERSRNEDEAVANLLNTRTAVRSPLLAAVSLPPNISNQAFAQFLQEPMAQGIVFEVLALELAGAPDMHHDRLREQWIRTMMRNLGPQARSAAQQSFEVFIDEAKILTAVLQEQHPSTIARLREDAHYQRIVCVLNSIERQLAILAGPELDSNQSDEEFVARYRTQLQQAHRYMTPPDFDRRRTVHIEDLYVSPQILKPGGEPPIDLGKLISNIDRTVVLGDPGGGKSTASQVIMYRLSQRDTAPVPFLVVLREFAAGGQLTRSVVSYLEDRLDFVYQCRPPTGTVERLLLSGRALVIFDGLDELLDTSHRREVTDAVGLFCNLYPLSRMMVTSRRVGYEQAPMDPSQFETHLISGFDDTQVEEYVRKWFSQEQLQPRQVEQWTNAFLEESSSVPDLRSNPLLLALMCIIYRGEQSIPRNRPAVYERCATLLFDKWDSSRKIHVDLRAGHLVDPVLKHLAFWMLTHPESQDGVTEVALIAETANYLHGAAYEDTYEAEAAAQEFVEFCRGRAWVFSDVGSTAEGEPLYKFTHRTFMEYFAAYHLARAADSPEDLAKKLAPKVANEEWDVIAQLTLQICNKHSAHGAERIFTHLLGERRRRSIEKRENVLGFLARCLSFQSVPPRTLRALVGAIVTNIVANHSNYHRSKQVGVALGDLLSNTPVTARDVVADEFARQIAALTSSSDDKEVNIGITLAVTGFLAQYFARSYRPLKIDQKTHDFWELFSSTQSSKYKEQVKTAASDHFGLRLAALYFGELSMTEFLAVADDGVSTLFKIGSTDLFELKIMDVASNLLRLVMVTRDDEIDQDSWQRFSRMLDDIGDYLEALPNPPWITHSEVEPSSLPSVENNKEEITINSIALNDRQLFACGALLCCCVELADRSQSLEDLKLANALRIFEPFVIRRLNTEVECTTLSAQSVPHQELFEAWARRELNFTQFRARNGDL